MKGRRGTGGAPPSNSSTASDELDVPLRQLEREKLQQQKKQEQQGPLNIPPPPGSRFPRHRSVSDGMVGDLLVAAKRSSSPASNNPLLPVAEDVQTILRPPPSPGTPPKKLWERQFGSFLRNKLHPHQRQRSNGSVNTTASSSTSSISPAGLPSLPMVPSANSSNKNLNAHSEVNNNNNNNSDHNSNTESSIRGGKFFASVFRPSSSSPHHGGSRKGDHNESAKGSLSLTSARRVKSIDGELDGTLRRGSEKAYAPTNRRFLNSASALIPPPPPLSVESGRKLPSTQRTLVRSSKSSMKKVFTDFHNSAGGDANSAYLGDEPSYRGHGGYWMAQQNQQLAVPHATSSSITTGTLSRSFLLPSQSAPRINGMGLALETVNDSLHKTTRGTASSSSSSMSHSQRVLKQIVGVETWQAGRRYLIAPAALAACPTTIFPTLLGSAQDYTAVEDASIAIAKGTASPFQKVLLGECHLSYTHNAPVKSQHPANQRPHSEPQWTSAVLVLCQNFLLEYAVDGQIGMDRPVGYCHLQYATVELHPVFQDCLELHFYGSPCAKADARVLLIRVIVPPVKEPPHGADHTTTTLDASAHRQIAMLARAHWKTCLERAASLTDVSDLYHVREDDPSTLLGTGQYSHVRAARRRRTYRDNNSRQGNADDNNNNNSTPVDTLDFGTTASSNNNPKKATVTNSKVLSPEPDETGCALKIFDKNQFWRMVVKGRERADTIVREAAVQATLAAQCGCNVDSFLKIRGFFETADNVVLELELLEGTDLFQHIASKNVLPEAEAAAILRDILCGLDAMNRIGLAHRDIKPANVLMCGGRDSADNNGDVTMSTVVTTPLPRVKIGDFGMAAFVGIDGHIRGRCGTPGYVAPEIFKAGIYGGYGNKVDIFSAGVTLYVMLCGYEPFYGETDAELVDCNKAAVLDFPPEDWNHISPEAKDLVLKMTKAKANERLNAREALQHPWFPAQLNDFEPPPLEELSLLDRHRDSVASNRDRATRNEDSCTMS